MVVVPQDRPHVGRRDLIEPNLNRLTSLPKRERERAKETQALPVHFYTAYS
jgi:hypothetical protein